MQKRCLLSFISVVKRSLLSFQAGLYKVVSAEAAISRSVFEFYCVLIKHLCLQKPLFRCLLLCFEEAETILTLGSRGSFKTPLNMQAKKAFRQPKSFFKFATRKI